MSLIPWSTLWEYVGRMDERHKAEVVHEIEQALLSMPEEEQIKALEHAPDEIKAKFSPQSDLTWTAEEWEAAEKRWYQIKEKR